MTYFLLLLRETILYRIQQETPEGFLLRVFVRYVRKTYFLTLLSSRFSCASCLGVASRAIILMV